MSSNHGRLCPICDSKNRTEEKSVEGFSIVSCDVCGFLYVGNPRRNTASEKNVELSEARHTVVPPPRRRHHYIKRFLDLKFDSTVDLLEIGAGYGALGKLLMNTGHEYVGFEPSKTRATVASNEGIEVIEGYYQAEAVDQQFDATILDNVIEHVLKPKQLLKEVRKTLKPNGVIIIIVPSRYDLRRLHPKWNDEHFWIPNSHVNFFRPSDLEKLYSTIGFQMHPLPPRTFGTKYHKDILFGVKGTLELMGIYPASLYTYGISD